MLGKLVGCARLGAQLLLIELFLPGGTLLVVTFLLARRFAPATLERWAARVPLRWTLASVPGATACRVSPGKHVAGAAAPISDAENPSLVSLGLLRG